MYHVVAQYLHLAIEKGLTFYQTRSNAIILQETLSAYCIPKVVRLKTGDVLYEKVYMTPRPPPKISLKHEWKRELGSEVARQPEGEVARQPEGEVAREAKFFQPTQPIPNPIRERSGRPDNMQDGRNTSRSQETNINPPSLELSSSERTGRLVETACNPNTFETEPKTQCKVCLSHWNIGIVYRTCGHFLRKGRGVNQQLISYTMDLLSLPEYVIKKGRPHGHRHSRKQGNKEYFTADQLKKKCKKNNFQCIHDRFIRDETFRQSND